MPWFIASYRPPSGSDCQYAKPGSRGQVCHHVVAAATVDYDVLDASPVALRPHTFTVRCNPSRSLNEIVITETVGADVTEFPRLLAAIVDHRVLIPMKVPRRFAA